MDIFVKLRHTALNKCYILLCLRLQLLVPSIHLHVANYCQKLTKLAKEYGNSKGVTFILIYLLCRELWRKKPCTTQYMNIITFKTKIKALYG